MPYWTIVGFHDIVLFWSGQRSSMWSRKQSGREPEDEANHSMQVTAQSVLWCYYLLGLLEFQSFSTSLSMWVNIPFASFEVCLIATCDLLPHGAHNPELITAGQQTKDQLLTHNICSRLLLSRQNGRTQGGWEWSSRPVEEDMQAPSNEGHIWQMAARVWEGPSNAVLALLRSPVRLAPLSLSILCYV